MSSPSELILIADDDENTIRFVEANLKLEGFEIAIATDGEEALHIAYDRLPDLMLLDVLVQKVDGYEVCQRLRADTRTRNISIIMLAARSLSADRVVGLTAGADDYLMKPFDPVELTARVKAVLRRSKQMRSTNPLTQLPGNVQVQEEVSKNVAGGKPFALLYIDLDNFKPFNDHYGFLRGDEAIKLLARCAGDAINSNAPGERFLGHVGGDDFIAIVHPESAVNVAEGIIDAWDGSIAALYDQKDVERGFIEIEDRRKRMHRYPICTVSIGIASNQTRPIESHWQASEIASEMKSYAKREPRSAYAADRRKEP